MTDPKRIGELMLADEDWRKLLRKRRPKSARAPWAKSLVDGEAVVVAARGPAREHQCWQALTLYRSGQGIDAIATTLSITAETATAWIRQAMGAR